MKGVIAFIVLLLVIAGGGGGYWAWGKWTKVEQRGVGLELAQAIPAEEIERLEGRYNEILDQSEILVRTVREHQLMGFYKVGSEEEAVEKFREDSSVKLPGDKALHVLFKGPRSTRTLRETAARTLAEDFVKATQGMSGEN